MASVTARCRRSRAQSRAYVASQAGEGWVPLKTVYDDGGFSGGSMHRPALLRAGRQINSAALIADGFHARVDGMISLAVVVGAIGVWAGFPLADPVIGLIITVMIFGIVWQSARAVFTRMLDGIEPEVLDEIEHTATHMPGF